MNDVSRYPGDQPLQRLFEERDAVDCGEQLANTRAIPPREVLEQPDLCQLTERTLGRARAQDLVELFEQPRLRRLRDQRGVAPDGVHDVGVYREVEPCGQHHRAQHPHGIFLEPDVRVADRPDDPLAQIAQSAAGLGHLATARSVLADFEFERPMGTTLIVREPIGVCGMITPWNWPLNQIACKVAPAIATGCTMVLKPSEIAPLNAIIFAEIMNDAGVPPGVFNLVNGDGVNVGAPLSLYFPFHVTSIMRAVPLASQGFANEPTPSEPAGQS